MTEQQFLLEISNIIDIKLAPLKKDIQAVKFHIEQEVKPISESFRRIICRPPSGTRRQQTRWNRSGRMLSCSKGLLPGIVKSWMQYMPDQIKKISIIQKITRNKTSG